MQGFMSALTGANDEGDLSGTVEEEEPPTESEGEGDGDATSIRKKKKKKKGNWKNIGTTPRSYATYPCECRWKRKFPREPCIKYKQVRWVVLPLSDRIAQMALPLLRRLLALWLEFGDKFPPEMRARLMAFLMENYGLTAEFLEQILEEARKAREEGGKEGGKKGKKGKKRKKKKSKSKSKPKEKKEREKPEKPEKKAKEKEGGLGFKRRKPGKLPFDWPYKMGSKFLLTCISYLSQDPDEDFNSRATEYFDVQSMGILEEVCKFMDMPLPDPERPTQCGETLVIMALNMSDWIAKHVIAPAQEIPDDMVEQYLNLRGVAPKPKKEKKGKDKKKAPDKDGKKGAGKGGEVQSLPLPPPPAEAQEPQRAWDEVKSPVYVPAKTRISKRKQFQAEEDEEGYSTGADANGKGENAGEEGVPRWRKQTLDDVKKEFLEYINWYNPWAPEFMYLGPKVTPEGVDMFKIWDADSEEVPADLRVLNWNIIEHGYTDNYSFIPSPVPQYYPSLRPLRPVRLEDLERSGIPKEVIRQNLRFFSPWYIMSHRLRLTDAEAVPEHKLQTESRGEPTAEPRPQGEDRTTMEDASEAEENFEDEMLTSTGPPRVKDSAWGDHKMKEQLEILCHLLHLTVSVPQLTIEHVFELLEEFCDAVECAEADENPSDINKLNLKKRTIILERYYLDFFGKKFRDYNDRTPYYMRTVCKRLAYYIQLLYEYTARTLWELQSRPNLPAPPETPIETPDDPQALQDWDEWLAWLIRVTKTCDEWAGWISETVEEAEKKATKKKGEYIGPDGKVRKLTNEEWFSWKGEVEEKILAYRSSKKLYSKESPYYLEKAKEILPVRHRPIQRYGKDLEEEGEGEGGWEDVTDTEDDADEEYSPGEEVIEVTDTEDTTAGGDTEYEDLTEND